MYVKLVVDKVLSKANGKVGKTKARRSWVGAVVFLKSSVIGLLFIPNKHTGVFIMREPS